MKVFVKGQPEVSLTKSHFVAEGGEGKVYVRGQTGYKIFHDPSKAIPPGKIKALAKINNHRVIAPQAPVYKGKRAQHVGHTFKFVKDNWTLCQLFPRAFREREGLDLEGSLRLVQEMRSGVQSVHDAGVLIVDLNEMNFLVSKDFKFLYFIDVDSYQTPKYPATAIMPSVRDPLVKGTDFTTNSDWWSFAIVSFQMLVGIHPFKGKHPTIKGFQKRMEAGISVFDSSVRMPKVAYDLSVIPPIYRDWYEALFVRGQRYEPPTDLQGVVIVRPKVRKISGTDKFEISLIKEFKDNLRNVFQNEGQMAVQADDRLLLNDREVGFWQPAIQVAFTPRRNYPIAVLSSSGSAKHTGLLNMADTSKKNFLEFPMHADETMVYDGTLYFRTKDRVFEAEFSETTQKVMVGTRLAANVLENASRLYQGLVLQNLLGEPHVSLFPKSGETHQMTISELKGHRVVDAKFDRGVLMVLASEKGAYHRYVFRFDKDYKSYDVRKAEGVTPTNLNFVVLDSGVAVCLNEDEQIELFSSRKGSTGLKIIEDPVLGGDMTLLRHQGELQFFRGNKLYKMSMK